MLPSQHDLWIDRFHFGLFLGVCRRQIRGYGTLLEIHGRRCEEDGGEEQ